MIDLALLAGATQIFFVCSLLLLSAVLFGLGVPISPFHVPLAAAVAAGLGWWAATELLPHMRARAFALTFGGSAVAFLLFASLEHSLYDVSWDGQAYHAEAILQLADGWNPVRGALPQGLDWTTYLTFWPKGPWVCAAAMYRLTGSIETGKAFHLLLMTACWLCSVAALASLPGTTRRWALVVSALLAFNPITLVQMHTFYVDGLLLSLLTLVVSLLVLMQTRSSRVLTLALASVVVLAMNVKLNGPIYLAILLGGYWLWRVIARQPRRLALTTALLSGGIAGGAIAGFNPFVSEFLVRLWHEGARFLLSDWMSLLAILRESPENFEGLNRVQKLAVSLFSASAIAAAGEPSRVKVPFTWAMSEVDAFNAPDVRVGGFGPLFSGGLLLALAVVGVLVIRHRREPLTRALLVLAALTGLSACANPEMWWARLAPQVWLAPVLVLLAGLRVMRSRAAWLPIALAATLVVNVVLIYLPNALTQYEGSQHVRSQLIELQRQARPLQVRFNRFAATRARFQQAGLRYTEVDALSCPERERVRVVRSEAFFCRQ